VQDWVAELISLLIGLAGGGTIGSLVTIKVVRSNSTSQTSRTVRQTGITAGRDNIGGDRINRG
jgi:hypothetical protein